jgi:transcription antitermination factor NusG
MVERLLTQKGYQCLLPTYKQKRKWSDRVVEIESPLFPSYIFCQFSEEVFGKAIQTQGVTRIVGFGGKPTEVEIEEVEALQALAGSGLLRDPWVYIPVGTRVVVQTGPLAGVEGIICPQGEKQRLIISVTLLQRSVAIHLDEETVLSVIEGPQRSSKSKAEISQESELALKLLAKANHRRA